MVIRPALLALLIAGPALAAPPPGADPNSAIGQWVRSLKTREGYSCCDVADCRPTWARIGDAGGWEVWIGKDRYGDAAPDAWQPVPAAALDAKANGPAPDGHVWACFYQGAVRCFFAENGG